MNPPTGISFTTDFSIALWVNIYYLTTTKETIYCKNMFHGAGSVTDRLCFSFDNAGFYFLMDGSAAAVTTGALKVETQNTQIVPQVGYHFIGVKYKVVGGGPWQVAAIVRRPDGTTQSSTYVTFNNGYIDDTNYHWCFGGRLGHSGAAYTVNTPFRGMINEVQIHNGLWTAADTHLYSTRACNAYCTLCKTADAPECIEEKNAGYLLNYDFLNQPKYIPTIPDTSGNAYNLPFSGTWTQDPIIVDRSGLYFDGTKFITAGVPVLFTTHTSFTVEGWMKSDSPTTTFDIFKIANGGASYFRVQLTAAEQFRVEFNALAQNMPTFFGTKILYMKWVRFGVVVHKLSPIQSEVTLYYGDEAPQTLTMNTVFADVGTATLTLGTNLKGYIMYLLISDWPKPTQHMELLQKKTNCVKFNDLDCSFCDIRNNFNCYSTCNNLINQNSYRGDCKTCHADCQSCMGSTHHHCYSCFNNLTFEPTYNRCVDKCGDGVDLGYHKCDDGNLVNGDGCTDKCVIEAGWECKGGTPTSKDTCTEICGDAKKMGMSACDDGNKWNLDGCSYPDCKIEAGWTCVGGTTTNKDTCTEDVVPDGLDYLTHGCDDANTNVGDGCDATGNVEAGWHCFYGDWKNPDKCVEICGDSKNMGDKPCDDGNRLNYDGCNENCTVEPGWTCAGGNPTTKDTCTEVCGSGLNYGVYQCDDGNIAAKDGCSPTCTIEGDFYCLGGTPLNPDTCYEKCGDGKNYGLVECDDGNTKHRDGCDENCRLEPGWTCGGGTQTTPDTCKEGCGEGYNIRANQCDDGNNLPFDGCDGTCNIEARWTCKGGGVFGKDTCYEPCGDGKNEGNRACDDQNSSPGDGCSDDCVVEAGWICAGGSKSNKDTCTEICGDGLDHQRFHCDDGNKVSGDGCTATCTVEDGFSCTGGTTTSADTCVEICGDGKDYFKHACEDGNVVSGDGCSSTCTIETGYSCTGGNATTSDTCIEICGDGIDLAKYPCDDGNTISGDGCSSTCTIEKGYQCSGGTAFNPDTCSDICQDGYNTGRLACDDGNNNFNDGCSTVCTVEPGWNCTLDHPSFCWKAFSPKIVRSWMHKYNEYLYVEFNESIWFPTYFSVSNWTLDIQGPLQGYSYTWSLGNDTTLVGAINQSHIMALKFSSPSQFFGDEVETITVNFKNKSIALDQNYSFPMLDDSTTFHPNPQDDSRNQCGIDPVGIVAAVLWIVELILALVMGTLGYSVAGFWHMTGTLQVAQLTPVMAALMPSCLYFFYDYLQVVLPEYRFIEWLKIRSDSFTDAPHWRVERQGFEKVSILNNLGDILFIYLIVGIGAFVFNWLCHYCGQDAVYAKRRLIRNLVLVGFPMIYTKVMFACWLNFIWTGFNILEIFSLGIALGFFLLMNLYPVWLLREAMYYTRDLYKRDWTEKRCVMLFGTYKMNNPTKYMIFVEFYVKRMLYTLMLAVFPKVRWVGLVFLAVTSLITMMWIQKVQPYKYREDNITSVYQEMMLFVCSLIMFYYTTPESIFNLNLLFHRYLPLSELFLLRQLLMYLLDLCMPHHPCLSLFLPKPSWWTFTAWLLMENKVVYDPEQTAKLEDENDDFH